MTSDSETEYKSPDEQEYFSDNKKKYNTCRPQGITIKTTYRNHLKDIELIKLLIFCDKYVIIPEFQRALNKIKVKNIKQCIMEDIDIISMSNPIQIGDFNNNHFLLDGQHRIEAFKELLKDEFIDINIRISVNITKCTSLEEMKRLYYNINIDKVNINDFDENHVESIIIEFKYKEFKTILANEFKSTFYSDTYIYSIEEYIYELKKIGFLEKFNLNLKKCIEIIIENNNNFKNYYTNDKIKDLKLTKKVLYLVENSKILSIKNNNFISVLINDKLKFKHN